MAIIDAVHAASGSSWEPCCTSIPATASANLNAISMPSKPSDAVAWLLQTAAGMEMGVCWLLCRVVAWEPVPHFRAFLEYALALNNFTALVELRSSVVADRSGESYTLTVPQRGIWGTASVNGGNIDRQAPCMHSHAALAGGLLLIWTWQGNAPGCRIMCGWRPAEKLALSLCLHDWCKCCAHGCLVCEHRD